ncbi:hypothetical protein NL676_034732 [Syzygium grande]|nr:hypothetical protein NL676_034732 [Syzygium grande]
MSRLTRLQSLSSPSPTPSTFWKQKEQQAGRGGPERHRNTEEEAAVRKQRKRRGRRVEGGHSVSSLHQVDLRCLSGKWVRWVPEARATTEERRQAEEGTPTHEAL